MPNAIGQNTEKTAKIRRSIICWLALSPLIVVVLFPFVVMLLTALKPQAEVLSYPTHWLPSCFAWQNFGDMWEATQFGTALKTAYFSAHFRLCVAWQLVFRRRMRWHAFHLRAKDFIAAFYSLRKCSHLFCW